MGHVHPPLHPIKLYSKELVGFGHARHNIKNSKQIFLEKEMRDHSPNSYIPHVSVSDLYIPSISLPILLQENKEVD